MIGAFDTVNKGLLKGLEDSEIRGRVETIQITALLRITRILRSILKETCCNGKRSSAKISKEIILDVIVIFWPSPLPKNAIRRWCTGNSDIFQWPVIERDRVGGLRLIIWDKMKVPLQRCTGREWPVNCMTVISAWWRLNIRFQRSSGRSCGRWIII